MTLIATFVAFRPHDATFPGTIVEHFDDSTRLEMKLPAHCADRTSSCTILLAGLVGGVLVFVVVLPLALSSPFPTPKQREWVVYSPPYPPPPLPSPASPGEGENMLPTTAASYPPTQLGRITFAERWMLDVPEAIAIAAPVANAARSVEAPARLAPSARAGEASHPSIARLPGRDGWGRPNGGGLSPVDQYLWEVYQRRPIKSDSSGNFTWKDSAAAKRSGMSLRAYVIGGMDPDFREQLYHAGHAMDASGIRWSILSAFRDDYRQRLAAGFKAHGGNSQHGGSNATGGYGHGRAIDITSTEGDASVVWHWIDAHGARFGLRRPMPGVDPAHVQPQNSFHDLTRQLREARMKLENKLGRVRTATAGNVSTVSQADEAGEGRRRSPDERK
jgi:hypothetical protein